MNGETKTVRRTPASGVGVGVVETAVELDGADGSIARARALTADFLTAAPRGGGQGSGGAVPARTVDLARLVVSELVTNALRHAPGPVLLRLRLAASAVEITVRDGDPALPRPCAPDPTRIGRHGLEIVRAVADEFHTVRETAGKRVVVRLRL
ncbi:ATP-binding protein [Streptomyces antibioticus]|uniref:ATP-binding protein n=1 Tax=Streptomyces antibioticus TaxID=1890 RepID=UPI000AE1545F|nr:ATP-binding protein [Streptomyces antibioticus]MCX4743843.1 ATP-binding protein [Streptomyces antibioticus]